MQIQIKLIPKVFIDEYNLQCNAKDIFVYMKIRKGMYGLLQADILTNQLTKYCKDADLQTLQFAGTKILPFTANSILVGWWWLWHWIYQWKECKASTSKTIMKPADCTTESCLIELQRYFLMYIHARIHQKVTPKNILIHNWAQYPASTKT